jgi:hypothetical protein
MKSLRFAVLFAAAAACAPAATIPAGAAGGGSPFELLVLSTTDVHGRIRGWDYYADSAESIRGLTRAATYLRAHKRELLAGSCGADEAYTLQQVLRIAIERADNMDLYLRGSQRDAMPHARWLLGSMARLFGERERPQLNL